MPAALLAARPVSFNLSTAKTFAPGEKPKIHLYAQNVDELEFRVYRVEDPAKFLSGLEGPALVWRAGLGTEGEDRRADVAGEVP